MDIVTKEELKDILKEHLRVKVRCYETTVEVELFWITKHGSEPWGYETEELITSDYHDYDYD